MVFKATRTALASFVWRLTKSDFMYCTARDNPQDNITLRCFSRLSPGNHASRYSKWIHSMTAIMYRYLLIQRFFADLLATVCGILIGKHCSSVSVTNAWTYPPPPTPPPFVLTPCSLVKYHEYKALEASEQLRCIHKLDTNPAGSDNKAHPVAVNGEH